MRVGFCILDVIHNTGEWEVYLEPSGYASTKSCRWKRILCTGVQSRAYSKQWARESLKAGATHQPNPRWKGVLSTWWVQSKARQMAGLLKGVGKRVDCPQSLFYFVPQEISQPSRLGSRVSIETFTGLSKIFYQVKPNDDIWISNSCPYPASILGGFWC